MGGHGTWTLALAEPDRFAAIAPVCGWSHPVEFCKIATYTNLDLSWR